MRNVSNMSQAATTKAATSTLRLANRLLVSLHDAADTTKAADLRAVIQNDLSRYGDVALGTVAQVSGLSRVPIHHYFREDGA